MSALQRLKSIREACKKHCTKYQNTAQRIMSSERPDFECLENTLKVLTQRLKKIRAMDQKIEDLIALDSIEEEVAASLDFNDKGLLLKNTIKRFLRRKENGLGKYKYSVPVTSVEKRSDTIPKGERCFNCLRRYIKVKKGKTPSLCRKFNRKHHGSLRRTQGRDRCKNAKKIKDQSTNTYDGQQENNDHEQNVENSVVLTNLMQHVRDNTILLQTASIFVTARQKVLKARVLFDTGSQRTFITRKMASRLGCKTGSSENVSVSSFGAESWSSEEFELVPVALISETEEFTIEALVTSTISSPIKMNVQRQWLRQPYLEGLTLADNFYADDFIEVDILIGCDYYGSFMTGHMIKHDNVIAMGTVFGWLLCGPIRCDNLGR